MKSVISPIVFCCLLFYCNGQIAVLGGLENPWETETVGGNQLSACPAGWVLFKANCYLMLSYTSHISWQRAQEFCQSSEANLASIENEEENKFVGSLVLNRTNRFFVNSTWIGLAKLCPTQDVKDGFRWVDGSFAEFRPRTYSWYGGNCVYLNATSPAADVSANWSAKPCNTSLPAICKKPLVKQIGVDRSDETSRPKGANSCQRADQCQLGSYCYRFISKAKSFEEASQICKLDGTQLLSIHNDDESNFTLAMTNVFTDVSNFWTGLNKLDPLAGWLWTDGSPVEYLNWQDGQPDGDNFDLTESCVQSTSNKRRRSPTSNPGEWDDTRCDYEKPFICKAQVVDVGRPILTPPTPTQPVTCDKGWTLFDSRCYKVFGDKAEDRVNYTDAQLMCRSHGGSKRRANLVSIRNVYEQMFVQSLLAEHQFDVWIGMASFWPSPNHFRWIDESPVRYSKWSETQRIMPLYLPFLPWGEPPPSRISTLGLGNNSDSDRFANRPTFPWLASSKFKPKDFVSCVRMSGTGSAGYWLQTPDDECANWTLGYVCSELGSATTNPESSEKNDNRLIGKSSIKFVAEKPLTWKGAEDYCKSTFGPSYHLMSITNSYEVGFSIAMAHSMRRDGFGEFWIGLSDLKKGSFAWSDDWPMYAELWGPGEPLTSVSSAGRCVKMILNREDDFTAHVGAEWRVADCSEPYVFACKANSEKPPSMHFTGSCSKGWKEGESACYYVNNENKTFMSTAEVEFCHRKYNNSHLVSFHSKEEVEHLIRHVDINSSSERFHIGLTKNSEGAWLWLDGSPADYFNWADGEPLGKNDPDISYCVEMDSRGKWFSSTCRLFKPFICKHWKTVEPTKAPDRTIVPSAAPALESAKMESAGSSNSNSSDSGRTAGIVFGIILLVVLLLGVLYFAHRRQLINIPFLNRSGGTAVPMSFNNPIRMDDENSSYVH